MYGMALTTMTANIAVLITLISGYLVVAYLVGKRLTRTQLLITNALYLMSAFLLISVDFSLALDALVARKEIALQIPELDILYHTGQPTYLWSSLIAIIHGCLIVASLVFMWQVRHSSET